MLNTRSTNTGAPQGCVLSPLLFSLALLSGSLLSALLLRAGCLVQSKQPGAQHSQTSGDDCGLQETPPFTIIDSTVTAVETLS